MRCEVSNRWIIFRKVREQKFQLHLRKRTVELEGRMFSSSAKQSKDCGKLRLPLNSHFVFRRTITVEKICAESGALSIKNVL